MLLILSLACLFVLAFLLKKVARATGRRRAIVPLMVGLVMIAIAVYAGRSTASLQLSGLRASGTVTALRLNSSGPRNTYDPLVRFSMPSGDIVEFEGEGSNPPKHRVGDVVEVMYAADRPTHAMINGGVRNWLVPGMFGLCALPLAFLAARAFVRR